MAVRFKVLGSGKMSALGNVGAAYTLYTVPAGKAAIVSAMRFCNTYTDDVPLFVTLQHENNPYPVANNAYIISAGYTLAAGRLLVEDEELMLGQGDSILGAAGKVGINDPTFIGKIHFVISGVERDV